MAAIRALRRPCLLMRAPVLVLFVALCACAHVPLATMYRLMTFDFAAADPAALRVAVRVPDVLAPRPGGVRLLLTLWRDGDPERRMETFVMSEDNDPAELALLGAERAARTRLVVYRLAPADVGRIRALREDNAGAAAAKARPHMAMGISAEACWTRPVPPGPVPMTTYIKLASGKTYLPLTVDVDLRGFAKPADFAKSVPPCG